jgi:hypothetical protein
MTYLKFKSGFIKPQDKDIKDFRIKIYKKIQRFDGDKRNISEMTGHKIILWQGRLNPPWAQTTYKFTFLIHY